MCQAETCGLKSLLEAMGVGGERLGIKWASTLRDAKLAESVKSFTQTVRQFAPSLFKWEEIL